MDLKNFTNCNKDNTAIHYCIWNQERINGMYLMVMINSFTPKKTAAILKSSKTICTRELTDIELKELHEMKGTRQYICWYYKSIEEVVFEDKKYGVETPDKFIEECKRLGYTSSPEELKEIKHYQESWIINNF